MGVYQILLEFLKDANPSVRGILTEVLLLEQRSIDLQRPQVKPQIKQIIDGQVRSELKEESAQ
jgi:hypothetical protein